SAMTRWRWAALVVLVLAAIFAWRGGVYSQSEYLELRHREATIRARMDSLRLVVDSLQAFRDSLVRYPDVQERLARERLGMVREGEILILLVPDSVRGN
ncbi:MAG TPA: septum formation initiator family protein, partial [Gemmatimonadales bacterium]|nr:septum formation initiator family protein [Gemmatimonadales bacterium]